MLNMIRHPSVKPVTDNPFDSDTSLQVFGRPDTNARLWVSMNMTGTTKNGRMSIFDHNWSCARSKRARSKPPHCVESGITAACCFPENRSPKQLHTRRCTSHTLGPRQCTSQCGAPALCLCRKGNHSSEQRHTSHFTLPWVLSNKPVKQ